MRLYTPQILADLDGIKARMAAAPIRSLPKEQQDAHWAEAAVRSAMARRAKAAYHSGQTAPRRRRRRIGPLPAPSRQFATVATTALRDEHMPNKAVAAFLTYLAALAGTTGYTDATTRALAAAFHRSPSSIKRYIVELCDRGYLQRTILYTPWGSVKGRRLTLTDLAWPYWHPKRQDPSIHGGFNGAPHITSPLKGESLEEEEGPRDAGSYPQRRRRRP